MKIFCKPIEYFSIPPLSCPRTDIKSNKQEYGVLLPEKLAKSILSIS